LVAALLLGLVALSAVIALGVVAYNLQLRKERDLVEGNFQLAVDAVDEILGDLDQETLLMEPHAEVRRRELLQLALEFSQELAAQKPESVAAQRSLGFCHRRLGDIHRMMGNHEEARKSYQEAIRVLGELREANPTDAEVSMRLAAAHGFLGELQRQTSQMPEARESYAIALELYDDLLQANPDEPRFQAESAQVLYNLSIVQKETAGGENDPNREERLNQARGSLAQSIEKLTALVDQYPDNRHYAQHLGRSYINLGSVMRLQKALRKGQATCHLAITQLEALCERYPNFAEYRGDLAIAHSNLGNVLQDDKQLSKAMSEYRLAESILRRVIEDHPKVPLFRKELANVYNSIGALHYRERDLIATRQAWEAGITLYEKLIEDFPEVPDYHGGLGMTHGNLGHVLLESGINDSLTLHHLETGLSELRIALKANPDQPNYLRSARNACGKLADLLKENLQSEETLRVGRELLAGAEANPVDAELAAEYAARMLKGLESSQEAKPWQKEFQEFAALAVEAFRKTPQGEAALQSSPRYEPLRVLLAAP
jgi:tetratricopeptide (TPR) repeat protein